jgi:nicotinate-nucleotide--dimethylbenzimidazole phosphoribosyltransferase
MSTRTGAPVVAGAQASGLEWGQLRDAMQLADADRPPPAPSLPAPVENTAREDEAHDAMRADAGAAPQGTPEDDAQPRVAESAPLAQVREPARKAPVSYAAPVAVPARPDGRELQPDRRQAATPSIHAQPLMHMHLDASPSTTSTSTAPALRAQLLTSALATRQTSARSASTASVDARTDPLPAPLPEALPEALPATPQRASASRESAPRATVSHVTMPRSGVAQASAPQAGAPQAGRLVSYAAPIAVTSHAALQDEVTREAQPAGQMQAQAPAAAPVPASSPLAPTPAQSDRSAPVSGQIPIDDEGPGEMPDGFDPSPA